MKPAEPILHFAAAGILLSGAMLRASEISDLVTNRAAGKPAAGDTVTRLVLSPECAKWLTQQRTRMSAVL